MVFSSRNRMTLSRSRERSSIDSGRVKGYLPSTAAHMRSSKGGRLRMRSRRQFLKVSNMRPGTLFPGSVVTPLDDPQLRRFRRRLQLDGLDLVELLDDLAAGYLHF